MRTTMLVAVLSLMVVGCGDDGGAGDTSSTSGGMSTEPTTGSASTSPNTGTAPTTGADDTSTGTAPTTGGDALTPGDLVGTFRSPACETVPDGMGGENHLLREFTLTETTWHLELGLFGDTDCTFALFTVVIDGPYTLLGPSTALPGATEGDFAFTSNVWTAHQQMLADLFTMSKCGADPWMVEAAQDVTVTGCIGVAHPIATCPAEHDLVALDGDNLYFGDRSSDLCASDGRPTKLGTLPLARQ